MGKGIKYIHNQKVSRMATTGTLRLEVIEARLTRDTEFFSKMDPYVVIETRQQKLRTKTM